MSIRDVGMFRCEIIAQRLEQLGWMFFLKIFDDREKEMEVLRDKYKSPLPQQLRWSAWATDAVPRPVCPARPERGSELEVNRALSALGRANAEIHWAKNCIRSKEDAARNGEVVGPHVPKIAPDIA